ncbi:MAG TPA: HIT family protein [Candidatus Thermoplasmatota archaeon]
MASDCIFCKIARGEIPSHKIHDDANTFAFLDIKPLAHGHALVIPKNHFTRIEDMPPEEAADLMRAVRSVTPAVCAAVKAPASTIAINNGKEGGQEVPHVHVHIVPRWEGDNYGPIHALFRSHKPVPTDDLPKLAEQMRKSATISAR